MTCYLHIGTMKTGTTSIQKFLYLNRNLLKTQNYYYPISIKHHRRDDHNFFAHKIYDFLCKNEKIENICYFFSVLKKEIIESNVKNIIISSENIQWLFFDKEKILHLRKILEYLGFVEIFIIVYLRESADLFISMCSELIKGGENYDYCYLNPNKLHSHYMVYDFKTSLSLWENIFNKKNLIIRLFDNTEFYNKNLLKDFIYSVNMKWDENFILPQKENESLNLFGFELLHRFNRLKLGGYLSGNPNTLLYFVQKYTQKIKDLKFQPSKEIIQSYIDHFEESNEWVRKEFFPHKDTLFPKKDLTNYKENYELKEMKPEYWDAIAEFVADIIQTKNQIIEDKNQIIEDKNQIIEDKILQIQNLEQINNLLSFQTKHGAAKARIQNQLSYKLGQAMIINSKSLFGYIKMPFVLSYIKDKHNQEQKIYKEKIKKDPSLKLPPLENYPDYQEALKEKECLTYKLGQALIKANKTWYKGGYVKLWFEIRKLKNEFKNKMI
ncbi:hypothetical protein [Campylobacter volucris]|uniref:hypothetical protein n=1 Tax=Campylobacter volucris TaxID=1031542 RepID=UPI0021C3D4E2|nr:hypothetical protein [Campylobacter volucris]